jgi:SAM-dependent methyltransferase
MNKVFDAYAAYYDLLYQDKNYHKEAKYILRLLEENGISSGKILELGSGTGKHAEEFAKMGFFVHGIDLSPEMVQEANHRNNNNLEGQLFFEVGDVRNFEAGKKFDAVISLFHVISYQIKNEDIQEMFKTAAKHLKPNGVFIFDFWYGPGVLTDPPAVRQKRLENKDIEILRIAEPVMYPNENVVDVNYCVHIKQKESGKVSELNETHKMRYLFIPEILQFSSKWFTLKTNFAWMKDSTPDFTDWLSVCILIKK